MNSTSSSLQQRTSSPREDFQAAVRPHSTPRVPPATVLRQPVRNELVAQAEDANRLETRLILGIMISHAVFVIYTYVYLWPLLLRIIEGGNA
ncbi:hypothetical protein V5O48_004593 [Marasmius crinis-equi]|uniref:Uncharacterized protein n=1 Tax=Marasmius crinis-equi TaxID=585013 RepID=A0ABR3FPS4_9AGAR